MKSTHIIQLIIAASAMIVYQAHAQDQYPSRPVKLVIPFAPGGSTDIVGRRLAEKLGAILSTAMVVDNRAGAGGSIGAQEVARSKPDGYSLLFSASSTQVIVPLMMLPNPPYDGLRDFSYISLVGLQHMSVATGPGIPAQNAKEFIAVLRANPGKYAYASAGVGSINHLTGEIFNRQANVQVTHVAYKGSGPAMIDVIGGHIAMHFATTASVLDHVRSGKARMIMTFSETRLASTPSVPTAIESGIPDMTASTFSGLFGPAALPRPIVNQVNQAVGRVLRDPDFQKNLVALGIEPVVDSTPESTTQFVIKAIERLAPVIKSLGIKLDR